MGEGCHLYSLFLTVSLTSVAQLFRHFVPIVDTFLVPYEEFDKAIILIFFSTLLTVVDLFMKFWHLFFPLGILCFTFNIHFLIRDGWSYMHVISRVVFVLEVCAGTPQNVNTFQFNPPLTTKYSNILTHNNSQPAPRRPLHRLLHGLKCGSRNPHLSTCHAQISSLHTPE